MVGRYDNHRGTIIWKYYRCHHHVWRTFPSEQLASWIYGMPEPCPWCMHAHIGTCWSVMSHPLCSKSRKTIQLSKPSFWNAHDCKEQHVPPIDEWQNIILYPSRSNLHNAWMLSANVHTDRGRQFILVRTSHVRTTQASDKTISPSLSLTEICAQLLLS